jgi:hypothetical protein
MPLSTPAVDPPPPAAGFDDDGVVFLSEGVDGADVAFGAGGAVPFKLIANDSDSDDDTLNAARSAGIATAQLIFSLMSLDIFRAPYIINGVPLSHSRSSGSSSDLARSRGSLRRRSGCRGHRFEKEQEWEQWREEQEHQEQERQETGGEENASLTHIFQRFDFFAGCGDCRGLVAGRLVGADRPVDATLGVPDACLDFGAETGV